MKAPHSDEGTSFYNGNQPWSVAPRPTFSLLTVQETQYFPGEVGLKVLVRQEITVVDISQLDDPTVFHRVFEAFDSLTLDGFQTSSRRFTILARRSASAPAGTNGEL